MVPSYVVFACSSFANDCEPLHADRCASLSPTTLTAGVLGLGSKWINLSDNKKHRKQPLNIQIWLEHNIFVNSSKFCMKRSAVTTLDFFTESVCCSSDVRSSHCLQKLGVNRKEILAFLSAPQGSPAQPPVRQNSQSKIIFDSSQWLSHWTFSLPFHYPWQECDLCSSQCWCDGRWWALCSPGRTLWWCSESANPSLHQLMPLPHPKELSVVLQQIYSLLNTIHEECVQFWLFEIL